MPAELFFIDLTFTIFSTTAAHILKIFMLIESRRLAQHIDAKFMKIGALISSHWMIFGIQAKGRLLWNPTFVWSTHIFHQNHLKFVAEHFFHQKIGFTVHTHTKVGFLGRSFGWIPKITQCVLTSAPIFMFRICPSVVVQYSKIRISLQFAQKVQKDEFLKTQFPGYPSTFGGK